MGIGKQMIPLQRNNYRVEMDLGYPFQNYLQVNVLNTFISLREEYGSVIKTNSFSILYNTSDMLLFL